MPPFYAHSADSDERTRWQLLSLHLREVARLAAERAAAATSPGSALEEAARAAGLLHDLGKYRQEFQDLLNGSLNKGDPRTWHKQAGARRKRTVC